MSALTQAMREYASAIRGDWSDFDGRSERDVIEMWVSEIETPTETTIEQWRDRLGLCADGNGHWVGFSGGYCTEAECPIGWQREVEFRAHIEQQRKAAEEARAQ